jgi:hypothetical protein
METKQNVKKKASNSDLIVTAVYLRQCNFSFIVKMTVLKLNIY